MDFKAIRDYVERQHQLKHNEPFVIGIDVAIGDTGRLQGVFLSEIEGDDGSKLLRVSSPVANVSHFNAVRCLELNWEQRVGYLAVADLAGEKFLQVCENLRYERLESTDIDYVIRRIAPMADELEQYAAGTDRDVT